MNAPLSICYIDNDCNLRCCVSDSFADSEGVNWVEVDYFDGEPATLTKEVFEESFTRVAA